MRKKTVPKVEPAPVAASVEVKDTTETLRFVGTWTAEELGQEWQSSQILRADTDKFVRSKAWALLSRRIEQEALENAEAYQPNFGDPLLARSLSFQKGVRWALRQIQHSTKPTEELKKDEPEPFGHIDVSYLEKRRRGDLE